MADTNAKVIIMIGPPGAGKGTQAELLIKQFGFDHISTGELVRGLARLETPLGQEVRARMQQGIPQPDEIILKAIAEYLPAVEKRWGILFDAFPLSIPQAEGLAQLIIKHNLEKPIVVYLEVSPAEIMQRLLQRNRPDDKPDVIRQRIEQYRSRMQQLVDHYTKDHELIRINGEQSVAAVHADVCSALVNKGYEYLEERSRS